MDVEDKDLPAVYLYFAVIAMIVIAVAAGGAFIILVRN
jgi:hypothetical protein